VDAKGHKLDWHCLSGKNQTVELYKLSSNWKFKKRHVALCNNIISNKSILHRYEIIHFGCFVFWIVKVVYQSYLFIHFKTHKHTHTCMHTPTHPTKGVNIIVAIWYKLQIHMVGVNTAKHFYSKWTKSNLQWPVHSVWLKKWGMFTLRFEGLVLAKI
jgi:hypothetical protein